MNRYRYEIAKSRSRNKTMCDDLERQRSMASDKAGRASRDVRSRPGGSTKRLCYTPAKNSFCCGDALGLLAYDYFRRSVRPVKDEQEAFLFEVETHLCGEEPTCPCRRVLDLIQRYFERWWSGKLNSGDRVSSVDSARITKAELDLIACVVESWV